MSWLFKSRGGDDGYDPEPPSPSSIGSAIGRQLRGVAAFLAPPPTPPSDQITDRLPPPSDSPTQLAFEGIRNDLAEISCNLKSGISNLASNLLMFPSNKRSLVKDHHQVVVVVPGISEDVVDFAVKISKRPGCWFDFPLSLNTEFELSEAQRAHATAIEELVPDLLAVKNEVRSCMDDQHFWLIYFILLMPRLNPHDFELLATCKVFETRDQLLQKLQKKDQGSSNSHEESSSSSSGRETENQTVEGVVDKIESLRIEERETSDVSSEEDNRQSFRDEEGETSFSDLDVEPRSRLRRPASYASGSSDWVQLSKSQGGHSKDSECDSSDWLPIGDSD
ncbi:unnamed protein product [Cochlearia groenlandica]